MKKKVLISLIVGFVIGVLWLASLRFFTVHNDETHYHANFGLYINGQREQFKSPLYYEEVQSCSEDNSNDPKTRAHMHNQENSIVHVHDNAVTWGQFFANIGFGLTDHSVMTDKGVTYVDGQNGKLQFMLNGQAATTIANKVIGDKDVLLVSFGSEDQSALKSQYDTIPADAGKYDNTVDPAGCSGSEPLTLTAKLKKAFNLTD